MADHEIDARAKTGTAPDEISELRLKSAHQSLITDVSRLRPYRCTIISHAPSNDIVWRHVLAPAWLDEGHQSVIRHYVGRNGGLRLRLTRPTRYWEHTLRDETDFARHADYIHFNPVKHGHVARVKDWRYSSFRRMVRLGIYPEDWAGDSGDDGDAFGER